jgi:hypothetical protein
LKQIIKQPSGTDKNKNTMLVIKGNLVIKQVRNSNNSESKFGID